MKDYIDNSLKLIRHCDAEIRVSKEPEAIKFYKQWRVCLKFEVILLRICGRICYAFERIVGFF